ncbi:MAG: PH domain-containing protein [Rivihabitans pingtungensis]
MSRQTIELNISKVESIQVNQGILGRIFNYGTLVISGAEQPTSSYSGHLRPQCHSVGHSWSPRQCWRSKTQHCAPRDAAR